MDILQGISGCLSISARWKLQEYKETTMILVAAMKRFQKIFLIIAPPFNRLTRIIYNGKKQLTHSKLRSVMLE
jgi:hypothetical protein